jgi:hypothetical protein
MIILQLNQCFYIPEVTKIKKMMLIIKLQYQIKSGKIVKVYKINIENSKDKY